MADVVAPSSFAAAAQARRPAQNLPAGALRIFSGARIWIALQQVFGWWFALTLVVGTLLFPWLKHTPLGYVPVGIGLALAVVASRRAAVGWSERRLMAWRAGPFVATVVAVAIALRVVTVLLLGQTPISDHACYHYRALSILHDGTYGPTAYLPPGMSFWLVGVYSIFGESLRAALLMNAVVGGLFTWLTYLTAARLVSPAAARLAAVLTAVFPSLVLYAATLGYDPLLGCALFGAVALFVRREPATTHPWWYVAIIGVVLGVTTYLKPIGLLLPAVFGLSYRRQGASWPRTARNTVLMAAALYAVITPWSIRNYRLFGEYVPLATNGGVALWVPHHEGASVLNQHEAPESAPGTSEVERDRQCWRAAWAYIFAHPGQLLRRLPERAAYLWGTSTTVMATVSADRFNPVAEQVAKLGINIAWTFVAAFFVVAVCRDGFCRLPARFWPLVALLAYVWGIHLFYEVQSRYHLPVLPVLFIGAAAALFRRSVASAPAASSATEAGSGVTSFSSTPVL